MITLTRRRFLKLTLGYGALVSGCQNPAAVKRHSAHIVVIGGGFAGATAAKYLKHFDPTLKVTLLEQNPHYTTCPGSNWVLGGFRSLDSLTVDYRRLTGRYGIDVNIAQVAAIDPSRQTVTTRERQTIGYDRLIVAAGIDFDTSAIDGYDTQTAFSLPHAWRAGPQTRILQQQVANMPPNGTIVISVPQAPFRCPPGPYERASLLAYFCRKHKPRAKIVIVDHNRGFAKQSLFEQGWRRYYDYGRSNSLIEWQSIADNPVVAVDPGNKTLTTDFGDRISADVLNLIPPQKAGGITASADLVDATGWCPVIADSHESIRHPNIHVIGDAARLEPLPKSAFAANSEAKVCAAAIVSSLQQKPLPEPVWINTCYSLLTPDQAISVAMVYKLNAARHIASVPGASGLSAKTDSESLRLEATYARNWYRSINADTFF